MSAATLASRGPAGGSPPGDRPVLTVMLGGLGDRPLEQLLRRGLEASALDSIDVALDSGQVARALLLADRPPQASLPAGVTLDLDDRRDGPHGAPRFHFGRRLAGAIAEHGVERLIYLGGGGAPLIGAAEFEALAAGVAVAAPVDEPVCLTNNAYSADLFALAPASLLACLEPPPDTDNAVPRRLREECRVAVSELPRSVATLLNIDSPVDLAALALSGRGGPRLRAVLRHWAPDTGRLERAAMTFTDRDAEVLVAGRVGARTWQYLERETACRVRVLAEERGMRAAGRDAAAAAHSMLGQQLEAVGPRRFFDELLPELCDAAFIDTRPALVQLGLRPSRADRLAADLGLAAEIELPALRELVEAAAASPVPVVLGGHSLVSGALMLLNDWAWEQHDRAAG